MAALPLPFTAAIRHPEALMLVTVVIPTYRRPDMLAELFDALGPQLTGETEVLVIDNDPEASARAVAEGRPGIRYIHETRRGVVHARNRGVAEAKGSHIIFLDDDEVPSPAWLAAFADQARQGVIASFGRIEPRFEGEPPPGLRPLLEKLFSREAEGPTGTDISAIWAYLGTGNAMFDKAACFPDPEPFDTRFNASGGEDIWMIRGLMARGIRLIWNREALVEEIVPAERMTLDYVKRRKFNQGRQRVIFVYGPGGPKRALGALLWMGVGAVQVALFGLAAPLLRLAGSARHEEARARVHAGLGKLRWRGAGAAFYG